MTVTRASEARTLSYLDAIREAMEEELERDERVFLIGEDVRSNIYGSSGGLQRFGESRIRDTPISEAGIVGAGIGAAVVGLRPIVDLTIASFVYCAMDQLASQAAKTRYMYGGQASVPLVVRAALYYGRSNAAHHSDRPHPMLMNVPGLKIITPATPADAKGMLKAAIRDDDPVVCFEDVNLWLPRLRGPVPGDGDFLVPLGLADVKRAGDDVTVVAISGALPQALAAAESLSAEQGISVEVVDPRTLAPMDWTTILGSVAKTGRLVVADPANRTCSAASEIVATAFEELGGQLQAVRRVTCPDVPIPYSPALERDLYPTAERIGAAVRSLAG